MALRERMLVTAPSRRQWAMVAALATALVVVAVLVVEGALTGVDQFSVDHLMPWLDPSEKRHNSSAGYWRPFSLHISLGNKLLDSLTYPCSLLISGLVVLVVGHVLWRRGHRVAAFLPIAAWVIGNGVEWIGKHTLVRPALYGTAGGVRIHVGSFDDSFPSGHMIRGLIVAYAVVLLWRRVWPWAALWAVLVGPALVLVSAHTVTDVVGGALIGLILIVLMEAAARPERLERARFW
jgi:membrane-associated phospholipid phosphatase